MAIPHDPSPLSLKATNGDINATCVTCQTFTFRCIRCFQRLCLSNFRSSDAGPLYCILALDSDGETFKIEGLGNKRCVSASRPSQGESMQVGMLHFCKASLSKVSAFGETRAVSLATKLRTSICRLTHKSALPLKTMPQALQGISLEDRTIKQTSRMPRPIRSQPVPR